MGDVITLGQRRYRVVSIEGRCGNRYGSRLPKHGDAWMSVFRMSPEAYQAHQVKTKGRDELDALVGGKKSKYGNKKTFIDGFTFDSKREAERYLVLRDMEKAGEISQLRLQPHIPCDVNGHHVCTYIADFAYKKRGAPRETFEDSKGARTALYIVKRKLVFACHGIEIQEV